MNLKLNTKHFNLPLLLLVVAGFLLRLYISHVDPFLHIWDERFHALVARNMMDSPFIPILRNGALFPADITDWSQGNIWVHKQPLFMWQMALSMKIFGATEYALRYPSVIMGTLMIPMVFDIARLLTGNKKIALYAAGLFCFSNFHVELVGGMRSMDHNDLCFQFYVLASIWAYIRYETGSGKYWILLIGLFSGAAILNKWLIGLFVFLIWSIKIISQILNARLLNKAEIFKFIIALFICCLIFMPWQIYISHQFPKEAAWEFEFNRRHLTEVLEGHEGNGLFYLARFPQLFGEGIFLLIFPGIYFYFKSENSNKILSIPILAGVTFVFIFLSFIVKTKVVSHMYFIAPFVMIYMGFSINFINKKVKRSYLITPILIAVCVLSCKPEKIWMDQGADNEQRNNSIYNTSAFKSLKNNLPKNIKIIANVPDFVSAMFYSKNYVVYESFSAEQLEVLKTRKCAIAFFKSIDGKPLPKYMSDYPYSYIIPIDLRSNRN